MNPAHGSSRLSRERGNPEISVACPMFKPGAGSGPRICGATIWQPVRSTPFPQRSQAADARHKAGHDDIRLHRRPPDGRYNLTENFAADLLQMQQPSIADAIFGWSSLHPRRAGTVWIGRWEESREQSSNSI